MEATGRSTGDRGLVQNVGDVGPGDGNDLVPGKLPTDGAQGRGGHHQIAHPVRAENGELHPAFRLVLRRLIHNTARVSAADKPFRVGSAMGSVIGK